MTEPKIVCLLRARREQAGLSQQALAERVGVSRQALIAIEAGRQVPSTSLALLLARALGCGMEDLFQLAQPQRVDVEMVAHPDGCGGGRSARVAMGHIDGRWVAHRLPDDACVAADGLILPGPTRHVEPLQELAVLQDNVLVAGCAPLLGILAQRAALKREPRVVWLPANGERALSWLQAGHVHVAGLHHGRAGRDNLAILRKRFQGRPLLVVNLTRWRQGFLVPRGNPQVITNVEDLLRPGLRFARRERAAGASQLVRRLLSASAGASAALPQGPSAIGHGAVAQLVACGAADVGVAVEGAAIAAQLDFVPLSEERFDLVLPAERASWTPLVRFLELINNPVFQREIACVPGYDTTLCGQVTRVHAA